MRHDQDWMGRELLRAPVSLPLARSAQRAPAMPGSLRHSFTRSPANGIAFEACDMQRSIKGMRDRVPGAPPAVADTALGIGASVPSAKRTAQDRQRAASKFVPALFHGHILNTRPCAYCQMPCRSTTK